MTAVTSALASSIVVRRDPSPRFPLPQVIRAASVRRADGATVRYADFDLAATAPALREVKSAVDAVLPAYSSVHRGCGALSRRSTEAFEQARTTIAKHIGTRPHDTVLFTRGTTDSANLLAHCLPEGTRVLVFDTEHHANLLPWRTAQVRRLGVPTSPPDAVRRIEDELRRIGAGPTLVGLSGASNVTGEIWPVAEITAVAKKYGAKVYLDAAQLAPHRRIDIAALGVDWAAFSGHKLYAPFGSGVLAGSTEWLADAPAYLAGGGASSAVWATDDGFGVEWHPLPARHEAGTPNLLGAVAIAQALRTLTATGWSRIAEHEARLTARLRGALDAVPRVRQLALWGETSDRIGVVTFTVDGRVARDVAEHLAADGIGVRDGAFCAHPLVRQLVGAEGGQAVRASLGIGTTAEDVDRLVTSVRSLADAA